MDKVFEFANGATGMLSFQEDGTPMLILSGVPGLPAQLDYLATQWIDAAAKQSDFRVAGGYADDPMVDFPANEVQAAAAWIRSSVRTGEFKTVFKRLNPADVF